MKIYVASSWRNRWQPEVVASLRGAGHEVYDFRHPVAGDDGFNWRQVHAKPVDEWLPADYQEALRHPRARESFELDMGALRSADAVVLVLPCGNDAHLEMGWAAGAGKRTVVFIVDEFRPGLMYLMNSTICTDLDQVHVALSIHRRSRAELDAEKWEADARAIPGQGNLHGKSYRLGFVDGRESAPPSPPAERPGAGERCQCGKKAIGEDFWHTVDGCVNRQIGPPAPPAVSEAGPGAESSQRSTNQGGSDGDDDRATDEGAGRGSGSGRGTESADRHEGRGGPREREADAGQGAGAHGGGDPLRRAVASAPAQPQGEGKHCPHDTGDGECADCRHIADQWMCRPTPPPEPRGLQFTEAQVEAILSFMRYWIQPKHNEALYRDALDRMRAAIEPSAALPARPEEK